MSAQLGHLKLLQRAKQGEVLYFLLGCLQPLKLWLGAGMDNDGDVTCADGAHLGPVPRKSVCLSKRSEATAFNSSPRSRYSDDLAGTHGTQDLFPNEQESSRSMRVFQATDGVLRWSTSLRRTQDLRGCRVFGGCRKLGPFLDQKRGRAPISTAPSTSSPGNCRCPIRPVCRKRA